MISVSNYHFAGDGSGEWIAKPGSLKIAFHMIESNSATQIAEGIVQSAKRKRPQNLSKLKKHLLDYVSSYIALKRYLSTPQGNVPITLQSADLDNYWHLYLMRGRELIDSIGKETSYCFNLYDKLNGIDKKKLDSLKNTLGKIKEKNPDFNTLLDILNRYEAFIIQFIELRNLDKVHSNTLSSPPYINPDGSYNNGVISLEGIEINFSEFFDSSYLQMLSFSCDVLGCDVPEDAKSPKIHR